VHELGTVSLYRQRLGIRRASNKYMGPEAVYYKSSSIKIFGTRNSWAAVPRFFAPEMGGLVRALPTLRTWFR
jgi:hypothetical protein